MLALLHPVAQVGDGFSVHPSTALGIAAAAALYEWRAHQGAREAALLGAPVNVLHAGHRAAFYGALLVLFASLNGPVHDLSDEYLFSAHMVQHLLLQLVVAPLALVGIPGWMLRPALRVAGVRRAAHRVTRAAAAFVVFNVVMAAWHLPPLYNLALAQHPVHILQHVTFLVASVVMWWPLVGSLPELPRPSYPAQLLYCFLMTIPMSIVAVYITYADRVLYPLYAIAPRVFGISPLEDQRLGGLIMWIPGGLYFLGVLSVVFFKWSQRGGEDGVDAAQVPA
jgi:putative membrane protein